MTRSESEGSKSKVEDAFRSCNEYIGRVKDWGNSVLDWAMEVEPFWVSFVVHSFMLAAFRLLILACAALALASVLAMLFITDGWILMIFPAIIAYCLYVALYRQRGVSND